MYHDVVLLSVPSDTSLWEFVVVVARNKSIYQRYERRVPNAPLMPHNHSRTHIKETQIRSVKSLIKVELARSPQRLDLSATSDKQSARAGQDRMDFCKRDQNAPYHDVEHDSQSPRDMGLLQNKSALPSFILRLS